MIPFNRRAFLGSFAAAVGGLLLPVSPLRGFAATANGSMKRRHLVNLIGSGGWDTTWFHNGVSERALDGVSDAFVSREAGGFEYAQRNATYKYTQKCSDSSEAELGYHPRDAAARLGPGMKWVFDPADYDDFLIWNGLVPAGSHEVGNNLILQGNSSSYALSFSSLISQALATDYARPLHYVLMADTPSELHTNFAMAQSFGVPVCIPDVTQFKQLTQVDPADVQNPRVRDFLAETVRMLTNNVLGPSLKMKGSRTIAGGFDASFSGANTLYGSDFTGTPLFKYLMKRYVVAMGKAFAKMADDPAWQIRGNEFPLWTNGEGEDYRSDWRSLAFMTSYRNMALQMKTEVNGLAALPSLAAFEANPAAYLATIEDFGALRYSTFTGPYWGDTIQQAYWYALADYLVRKDLSAVVDIPAWVGLHGGRYLSDMHVAYMAEIIGVVRTMAGFKAMIQSFKEISLAQGGTLLDCTMIALHTEFDRQISHGSKGEQQVGRQVHVGTNHGDTASILLAGYGVQRGKVIGGINLGPGVHGAYVEGGQPAANFGRPLPIDIQTGALRPVGAGGAKVSTLAVFPTIMAAYGVSVPIQQITDWNAIPAVIKNSG